MSRPLVRYLWSAKSSFSPRIKSCQDNTSRNVRLCFTDQLCRHDIWRTAPEIPGICLPMATRVDLLCVALSFSGNNCAVIDVVPIDLSLADLPKLHLRHLPGQSLGGNASSNSASDVMYSGTGLLPVAMRDTCSTVRPRASAMRACAPTSDLRRSNPLLISNGYTQTCANVNTRSARR